MVQPRSTSPNSIMPSYPWLRDNTVDFAAIPPKMRALDRIAVPYRQELIDNAESDAKNQAQAIADGLSSQGETVNADSELIALIAYLQKLGTDIKKAPQASLESTQGENL